METSDEKLVDRLPTPDELWEMTFSDSTNWEMEFRKVREMSPEESREFLQGREASLIMVNEIPQTAFSWRCFGSLSLRPVSGTPADVGVQSDSFVVSY